MTNNIIKTAFTAGELAPSLYARTDLAKSQIGAKLLRNFFVHPHGGASNRAGTIYVGRCRRQDYPVRLIPFEFNTLQTYMLEFGHEYMRVIKDGGYVLEAAKNITAITQASPGVINSNAHGFVNGDWIFLTGIGGMTQLNGVVGLAANVTANNFQLQTLDGVPINTSGYTAYTSGGTAARVYTIATPYNGNDLFEIRYAQSADVMTLCHPDYSPRDLTRTGHAAWTLTTIISTVILPPTGVGVAASIATASTTGYRYRVTAVDVNGVESLVSASGSIANIQAMSTTSGQYMTVSWTGSVGAVTYNIYRQREVPGGIASAGSLYGFVGSSTTTSFVDANISPDFSLTPPIAKDPFASNNWPGVVSYYEQRKVFGGSTLNPQTMWFTQPGNYTNFNTSDPTRDGDAITATIVAAQVNQIRHFVPLGQLVVLTSGGAWNVTSGSGDVLAPSTVTVKPQAYSGCSDVPPLIVNTDILYVQARGSTVRNLSLNAYTDSYNTGTDMSILSNHLFYGHQIVDWTYAEEPFKLIYAVREDGTFLMFTYLREQDVYAWTSADSLGDSGQDKVKAISSINENSEDAVYMVVERTIPGVNSGNPVKYVERQVSRNFLTDGEADVTKCWFVDCGLQYVGSPTSTLSGLQHLEGCELSVLADGSVQPSVTVTNGSITIQSPASIITVGLPYMAQIRTLNLDIPGAATVAGKRKKICAVSLRVENTRGLKVGQDEDTLLEIKERFQENYGEPIPLFTGDERITLNYKWSEEGDFFIQQDNPLPATVLGYIPEIQVGDN